MANDELGKLSPEQLQKLAGVISEAKGLTNQQEEIIKKVLAGETEIGNLRIASLEKYFDIYSRNLDLIARKHSTLNDAFLILDKKLTDSYKLLSSNNSKANTNETPKNSSGSNDLSEQTGILYEILGILKEGVSLRDSEQRMLLENIRDTLKSVRSTSTLSDKQVKILTNIRNSLKSPIKVAIDKKSQIDGSSVSTPQETPNSEATGSENIQEIIRQCFNALQEGIINLGTGSSGIMSYEPNSPSTATPSADTPNITSSSGTNTTNVGNLIDENTRAQLDSATTSRGVEAEATTSRGVEAEAASSNVENNTSRDDRARLDTEDTKLKGIIDYINSLSEGDEQLAKQAEIKNRLYERENKLLETWSSTKKSIEQRAYDLEIARIQAVAFAKEDSALTEEERMAKELATTEARLAKIDEVTKAEEEAQKLLTNFAAEIAMANSAGQAGADGKEFNEAGDLRAREVNATDEIASAKELAKKRAEFIAEEERKAQLANNGILTKEEATRIQKDAAEKFKADKKNLDKTTKLRKAQEEKDAKEKEKAEKKRKSAAGEEALKTVFGKGQSIHDRIDAFKSLAKTEDGESQKGKAALALAVNAISDLAKQLNDKIDQIGKYKGDIDTRLQGSNNQKSSGSYWDQLTKDMMSVGAVTPFFKQETFANNIKELVSKGISFDLKQRAFLMTIQEKIANTFNVADGTLLRLIRIQQQDTTAGRLGMESALNTFLNQMYETTEYLTDVAASVRTSLEEMESLMGGNAATEVEYQVQKWMGSLYSVGMSQNAVTSISTALGQIASGQVDALTNGGAGNLLVMAANNAGIQISDILSTGLNAENTNKLLQATVNYLAEIAETSKGNNVVQQQLANVFGVKASDLKAATNLKDFNNKDSTKDIIKEYKTYSNMLNQLNNMAGTLAQRTSIGERMSNVWENGQYTLASSMANSSVAYITYKMASLLDATTGGIALPWLTAFGNGVSLETTVSDLMRVASMSAGIIGSIGPMISGLGASFNGRSMLTKMGIGSGSGLQITPRGGVGSSGINESNIGGGNTTTSGSGYIGNSNSSDIKNSTIQEAEDTKKQLMIEAKEEEADAPVRIINTTVLKIYELLDDVAHGKSSLSVKVSGYGLTSSRASSLGNAQGGVAGLLSNASANSFNDSVSGGGITNTTGGTANSTSSNINSVSPSYSNSSRIDLGGWTLS